MAMARVAIVTDSTAYIPVEISKKLGISVVPLNVQWNNAVFDEADPSAV